MDLRNLETYSLGLLNGAINIADIPLAYNSIKAMHDVMQKPAIDKEFMLSLTKHVVEKNADKAEEAISLYNKLIVADQNNISRMTRLSREITDIYFALKNGQAIQKNLPSYIQQINLDFTSNSLFSVKDTNVVISNNTILGIANQPAKLVDYTNVTLDTYLASDISVSLIDSFNTTSGYITSNNINTGSPFSIGAESKNYNPTRSFEILINRQNQNEINQIDISLSESHLIELHSSKDNITFTPIFNQKIYVKQSIIPFAPNSDQYLKIIIYKNSDLKSVINNGYYVYKVDFNHLYISKLVLNSKSGFITNNIDPKLNSFSGISIDTCDNYQDKNVNIEYAIDFNNENNWQDIKPIGKIKEGKQTTKAFIKVNNYFTNKLIKITSDLRSEVEQKFVYNFNLEGDFLKSNQVKVFTDNLFNVVSTWNRVGNQYQVYGILDSPAQITVSGNYPVYLNGIPVYGQASNNYIVNIDPGVYDIRVSANSYVYLFNKSLYKIKNISATGIYTLVDRTGAIFLIQDNLYPYNLKQNIENAFDFLFKTELIENTDFYIYNNPSDNTNNIITYKPYNNLYIAYRLFESDTQGLTFRIKADYTSLDSLTIPYTERIIVRCV
jgi:hypothetical protein